MVTRATRAKKLARYLVRNPRYLAARARGGLHRLLFPMPKRPVAITRGDVTALFDASLGNLAEDAYHGQLETPLVVAMRKHLRAGDVFIDVGANVGFISLIALGIVGRAGQVHSFEPVPEYFKVLQSQAAANSHYQWTVNQWALGDSETTAMIAVRGSANMGLNSLVPGFFPGSKQEALVEVRVSRLDRYVRDHGLWGTTFIKIDTEGYEYPVLRGLDGLFDKGYRPVIACEVTPVACSLLSYSLAELEAFMAAWGYGGHSIYDYSPLAVAELSHQTDVLFLPR